MCVKCSYFKLTYCHNVILIYVNSIILHVVLKALMLVKSVLKLKGYPQYPHLCCNLENLVLQSILKLIYSN